MALRKFLILRRPRKRPSRRVHGADPANHGFLAQPQKRQGYAAAGWASDQANNSAKEALAKSGGCPPAKPRACARILRAKASACARSFVLASATPLRSARCSSGVSGIATRAA